MNKSIILVIISIVGLLFSCNKIDQNIYEINGEVTLNKSQKYKIILVPSFVESDNILGTSSIINGSFHITGPVDHDAYQALILVTDSNLTPIYPSIGTFLSIEHGTINVKLDSLNNAHVEGTPLNDQMQACKDCITVLDNAAQKAMQSQQSKEKKLNDYLETKKLKSHELMVRIALHINEEIFQEMLNEYYYYFNKKQLDTIFSNMEETTRIKPFIQTIKRASTTAPGEEFINIIAQNPKGEKISLENILPQSKFTLVDVWASWCGPCIREFKKYEILYNKYSRSQFNFIAFSLDSTFKEWTASLKLHKISGLQITDLKGWKSPIANEYGLTFIPSSILIDADGYIIARNPSTDEIELYIQ